MNDYISKPIQATLLLSKLAAIAGKLSKQGATAEVLQANGALTDVLDLEKLQGLDAVLPVRAGVRHRAARGARSVPQGAAPAGARIPGGPAEAGPRHRGRGPVLEPLNRTQAEGLCHIKRLRFPVAQAFSLCER